MDDGVAKETQRLQAKERRHDFVTSAALDDLRALERQRVDGFFDVFQGRDPVGSVALYYPMGSEASTLLLASELWQRGVAVSLPCVVQNTLVFREWCDDGVLMSTSFGIQEPALNSPQVIPAYCIVPLLAFDGDNHRLGYGKGYYDRYFSAHTNVTKIGWAYECQRVDRLLPEPHDVPLDFVLT